MDAPIAKTKIEDYLRDVNYLNDRSYVPSKFALDVVNLIKLIEGGAPENVTPIMHYRILDTFLKKGNTINLCFRGSGKTTVTEFVIWYIAIFGELPSFGGVQYGLYISDSMDNGVKKMKRSLQHRWDKSSFLQEFVPRIKLTEDIWEFWNKEGVKLVFTGHGAKTGIRGTRENNTRPQIALADDIISDADARSQTMIDAIRTMMYSTLVPAMHQVNYKIIWNGTPFHEGDPIYSSAESGAWNLNVFPICEQYPCERANFRGAWEDRFSYDVVNSTYKTMLGSGSVHSFNQEYMLRIISRDDCIISEDDIMWYERDKLLLRRDKYNYYITTDFGYTTSEHNDYSVISVWAVDSSNNFFWVDGVCKRQLINQSFDDIFRLAQIWRPLGVGLELSGQQGGYVTLLQEEMRTRNIYFRLAGKNGESGIRPSTKTSKFVRFTAVVPWFKNHRVFFPIEEKYSYALTEAMHELSLVSATGFKSRHDDFLDSISMLSLMDIWRPSYDESEYDDSLTSDEDYVSPYNSYIA